MSEKLSQNNKLNNEEVKIEADRLHSALAESLQNLMKYRSHRQITPTHFVLGNNRNFINAMGVGTDTIHLIVGKTPDYSADRSHHHLDIAHLLHIGQEVKVDTGGDSDTTPYEFDSWDTKVSVGEVPQIQYASHSWKAGIIKEDGKEKKGIIFSSPSEKLQENNAQAVQGIEELLPHLKSQK